MYCIKNDHDNIEVLLFITFPNNNYFTLLYFCLFNHRKSAYHANRGDNEYEDKMDDYKSDLSDANDNDIIPKTVNTMCVSRVDLEDTVSWLLSVFQVNLQKANQKFNPV